MTAPPLFPSDTPNLRTLAWGPSSKYGFLLSFVSFITGFHSSGQWLYKCMEQKKVLAQKKRVRLPQGWVGIPTWPPLCRSFLHDVTAAILGYKTIKRRPWCYIEKIAVGIDLCPRVNTFFVSRNWHNHCFGTQIWQTRRYLETVLRFPQSLI